MELSQGQIIQKPNKQELLSLFMTHRLNVMHAPVKFHKYIPYGLGVMAQTQIGTDVRTYTERKKKRRVNFIPKFHSSLKKFVKYFTMITKRYLYGTKVPDFIGL